MISGLLEDIKHSSTSVVSSTYVQNVGLSNYVFGSQHDVQEFSILLLDKCFPDIDQIIFQNKVIESSIFGNANNSVFVCVSHCLLWEVNS